MRRGEIYLASFPFGDTPGMKVRPVLLLTGRIGIGTEVLVAYICSLIPIKLLDTDLKIDPRIHAYRSTNLKTISVLRLHKLATIHDISLKRRLGEFQPATIIDVDAILRKMLALELGDSNSDAE